MFKRFWVKRKMKWYLKTILILNFIFSFCLLLSYLATHIRPDSFWQLALMGLLFPVFFYINLFFLLFWLLLRSKWLLLSLICLAIGFNHVRHFFQVSFFTGPKEEKSVKLKIITYNVSLFDLYEWKAFRIKRNHIFSMLDKEDPDVVCFQEFYYNSNPGYFETRDTLVRFLRTRHYYEGYTHKIRHGQHFGVATFSAYPIVNAGEIIFPNDRNNNAIFTDLKINNDTVRVYNAHLSSIRFRRGEYDFIGDTTNLKKWTFPNQKVKIEEQRIIEKLKNGFIRRTLQTEILMEHIKACPHRVILTGDFNDTPVSYFYRQVTRELYDSFIESGNGMGSTYNGVFPFLRIDYIFHSKGLHGYGYKTLPGKFSDHYAVETMVEVLEEGKE